MKMHVFAVALSSADADSQPDVLRNACPVPTARAGTSPGEPSPHRFDVSDEELSAMVEWLSLEREAA